MEFRKINSFAFRCTREELKNIFDKIKANFPEGFISNDLANNTTFVALREKTKYISYNTNTYAKNLLLQRFKVMGLTIYNNKLNKWLFVSEISVSSIVEQMQSLESQLIGLGYDKIESAVFEKSEVIRLKI